MKRFRAAMLLVALAAVASTAGCAAPGPHVYNENEFKRKTPDFGKERLDIDSVVICYNKSGTKPEIVANMASAECARYNKKAEFLRQTYKYCPLTTPVAAEYNCVAGK